MANYIIFNGAKKNDYAMANVIYANETFDKIPHIRIKNQIQWIKDNCENVNDINVANAMEYLWYNNIGIFSPGIQKCINDTIVELGIAEY